MPARTYSLETWQLAARIIAQTIAASQAPAVDAPAGAPIDAPKKVKAFYTKAEIAAGLGFDCALGCGRRLRTAAGASSHDTTAEHYHVAAK